MNPYEALSRQNAQRRAELRGAGPPEWLAPVLLGVLGSLVGALALDLVRAW